MYTIIFYYSMFGRKRCRETMTRLLFNCSHCVLPSVKLSDQLEDTFIMIAGHFPCSSREKNSVLTSEMNIAIWGTLWLSDVIILRWGDNIAEDYLLLYIVGPETQRPDDISCSGKTITWYSGKTMTVYERKWMERKEGWGAFSSKITHNPWAVTRFLTAVHHHHIHVHLCFGQQKLFANA